MDKETFQVQIAELLEKVVPQEYLAPIIDQLTTMGEQVKEQKKRVSANRTVLEFHKAFNADIDQPITIERINHRLNLMFEELSEFAEAGGTHVLIHYDKLLRDQRIKMEDDINHYYKDNEGNSPDPKEMLDALADLTYVTAGTNVAFGFHRIFDDTFNIVHANNMNKLHDGINEVEKTSSYLAKTHGEEFKDDLLKITPMGKSSTGETLYFVSYNDKIIKPRDHVKVSLDEQIEKWEEKMESLYIDSIKDSI